MICAHCHGTGQASDERAADLQADIEADALRLLCREYGYPVTGDGRVTEAVAAALMGKKPKTLSNWRYTTRPLEFVIRSGRALYDLRVLARWLRENAVLPLN